MKIALVFERDGTMRVVSELPVEAYIVDEHAVNDRVYRLRDSLEVGDQLVEDVLGDDVIWSDAPRVYM